MRNLSKLIFILSVLGLFLSIYLSYTHFTNSETTFCLSGSGCDLINNSAFSKVFGIPIPIFGLIGYLIIAFISYRELNQKKLNYLYFLSLIGIAFSIYLTYLELFIIKAICSYCVISALIIVGIFISVLLTKKVDVTTPKNAYTSLLIILLVFGFSYFAHSDLLRNRQATKTVIDLAKHLTNTGSSMYGSYTCTHCETQKLLFGDAFQYINYIECNPAGENSKSELCLEKGIDAYPTWEINESIHVGAKSLKELAKLTGFKPKKQPEK